MEFHRRAPGPATGLTSPHNLRSAVPNCFQRVPKGDAFDQGLGQDIPWDAVNTGEGVSAGAT
jgi:hypothetical protein